MIYVCSDIHGQYELYKRMLKEINFSDNDTLYILGDVIDRGPDSIPLLLDIMSRKNVILLLGNHELMMVNNIKMLHKNSDCWFLPRNKGVQTAEAFYRLQENKQNEIIDYLCQLPLQIQLDVNGKNFLLSHSFYIKDAGTISNWRSEHYLTALTVVWSSPWREKEDYVSETVYEKDGNIHIIGHVPVLGIPEMWKNKKPIIKPYISKAIINIDLGCAYMDEHFKNKPKDLALCCMDLEKYANDDISNAFYYFTKKIIK